MGVYSISVSAGSGLDGGWVVGGMDGGWYRWGMMDDRW